jgi:uncharacterized protein (TIGR02145 family)
MSSKYEVNSIKLKVEKESHIKIQMKKHIQFIGFLLIILGLQTDAQTLKNIYRHNQPVLRIPTALIDKVETAEINGQLTLRVIQFNGFVNQVPLALIDSITHSEGEAIDPAQLGQLRTASVVGVVRGTNNAPVFNALVRSPFGGEETRSDPNGVFVLNDILVYENQGFITIERPGFHKGSRSFLPLDSGSSRVNVQLLPMTQSGTFNSSTGGSVYTGALQLNFPANAIQLNGQPYTGFVRVYSQALDPTSTAMFDQMPGELLGSINDSLRFLRSFGMASIELRDPNMNELQLLPGVTATLIFNIPSALQAEAPQTIDWWSFDETLGYWIREGVAQKQGNSYVGQASHFSWWNLDKPSTFNEFHGTVYSTEGNPVSEAMIKLYSPAAGTLITYTNSAGEFSGRVPRNQLLSLNIHLVCDTINAWAVVYSENIASENNSISDTFTVQLTGYFPITGLVVNCAGQPVQSGYVKRGFQTFITNGADFLIPSCTQGEFFLQGFDTSIPDSVRSSALVPIQVGPDGASAGAIQACSLFLGAVADIEGNNYPTVLIGNQEWMAQNLRTAFYANGDSIPNLTDNAAWMAAAFGAWCNYNNSINSGQVYGKLYKWYATVDPRNVCPAGWHVPSDAEWNTMIGFIDSLFIADTIGAVQSSIAGGKLKSVTGWSAPNTAATNETGFSALPGGYRNYWNQYSYNINTAALFWTSTAIDADWAYNRFLNHTSGDIYRDDMNKRAGHSVRCVRD